MEPIITTASVGGGVIGAAKATLGVFKKAAETLRILGKAEVMNDLIDAQIAMMDLIEKHQVVIDEHRELRSTVSKLQEQIKLGKKTEHHFSAYWTRGEDGALDGPFSQHAYDQERKLVRLFLKGTGNYGTGVAHQFWCKAADHYIVVPIDFYTDNKIRSPRS